MTERMRQATLTLNPAREADGEKLERLTRQLRSELLELDVEAVELTRGGKAPPKSKAGDAITWGTLLLTLAASGGVLTTLIQVLQSWLTRHEQRSLTLEIDGDRLEITGISSKEQRRLVEAWLHRRRSRATTDE